LVGAASTRSTSAADDAAALRLAIDNFYSAYSKVRDKARYRLLVTDDYLLLENGEILDIEGDLGLMPSADSRYTRSDSFDFRSTRIEGNVGYVVYFLRSEIVDEKGTRHREWLESAILRRADARASWLVALLHSTRIERPAA
jgi:ketosteroid isomerase-like protein